MLLIDIGNSRIKYTFVTRQGFIVNKELAHSALTKDWMSDTWGLVENIYIASVAHKKLVQLITDWATHKGINSFVVKSEASYKGLVNAYDEPQKLGVDRWLAMLGGKIRYPHQNLLIIDTGTATTVDFVSSDGVHQGGWIFPGLNILVNSVIDNTVNVSARMINPLLAFGHNTEECLNFSALSGTIGLIEKAIILATEKYKLDQIIVLGGNAELIVKNTTYEMIIAKDLIFHGLLEYSKESQ